MSATISHPTSPPGLDGAACAACHAPLGEAARYCLSCGARQAGARTELLDLVAGRPAVPVAPPTPAAPAAAPTAVLPAVTPAPAVLAASPVGAAPVVPAAPPVPPATVGPSPAGGSRTWPFALTAVVLVALVVGLFLGRWLADGRDGSSAPQVIRIEGVGGAAAPGATPAPVPSTSGGTE